MIEILNTYDDGSEEKLVALKQLPKNVRQIGEVESYKKVFLEDYVYTYLYQYASFDKEHPKVAILLGKKYKFEDEKIILINGAIKAKYILNHQSGVILTNETWSYIYEKLKEYFSDYEIIGWMFSHPGYSVSINEQLLKVHTSNFPGRDKVLFVLDPVEREDAMYLYEQQKLKYQTGYYIYYERNEAMHKYMLEHKIVQKEETLEPEEEVIVNYRKHLYNRRQEVYQRKLINMLYVASGALAIIVLVIGVALLNNYDKMKNLETTLNNLSHNISYSDNANSKSTTQAVDQQKSSTEEENTDQSKPSIGEQTTISNEQEVENDEEQNNPVEVAAPEDESTTLPQETEPNEAITSTSTSNIPKDYIVQAGDTLAGISYKFYKNFKMSKEILNINQISNPDKIYIGQKLKLPQP